MLSILYLQIQSLGTINLQKIVGFRVLVPRDLPGYFWREICLPQWKKHLEEDQHYILLNH